MHKIMVVDDEVMITDELEELLDSHGYQVVGKARSGMPAVDMAKKLHPDLVLMDIVMPGEMDGIEACDYIQKDMNIPVVFLTAYGDDAHISRDKAVYPYGYVMKPYHDDQIKAVVECALEKKKMEQDLEDALNKFRFRAEGCELKFKEIHHRVKNNLNAITSFLSLKALCIDDKRCLQALREVSARVYSIADIHDRLCYSKDLESICCQEYFKSLKKSLERAYLVTESVRLSMDAEDLELDTEKILSIGIIVTELVSNALKHAFPKGTSGEIKINIRSADDTVVLTVKDNGIGFPEGLDFRKTTEGMGLEIIRGLVRQWQGNMEVETTPRTAFKITLPA